MWGRPAVPFDQLRPLHTPFKHRTPPQVRDLRGGQGLRGLRTTREPLRTSDMNSVD